jgi:hypothetical protein
MKILTLLTLLFIGSLALNSDSNNTQQPLNQENMPQQLGSNQMQMTIPSIHDEPLQANTDQQSTFNIKQKKGEIEINGDVRSILSQPVIVSQNAVYKNLISRGLKTSK